MRLRRAHGWHRAEQRNTQAAVERDRAALVHQRGRCLQHTLRQLARVGLLQRLDRVKGLQQGL